MMERNRSPMFMRQNSTASNNGPGSPAGTRHSRSASYSGKPTNIAARNAAALKLAEAMNARYERDDDEVEDDINYNPLPRIRSTPPTIDVARVSAPGLRPAIVSSSNDKGMNYKDSSAVGVWAANASRITMESCPAPIAPPLPRDARRLRPTNVAPMSLSTTRVVPVPLPNKTPERFRRPSIDFGTLHSPLDSQTPNTRREVADLNDQVDMLQDEKASLLDKLQLVESQLQQEKKRSQELEKQFEKQVAILGNGASLESRHQYRLEQAMKYRNEATRAAKEVNKVAMDEEIYALREQMAVASTVAKEVETEVRVLRAISYRISLTCEEKQDLVMKRCWLARYWTMACRYGIYPELANERHEHWSALVPRPLEIVLLAAEKACNGFASHMEDDLRDDNQNESKRVKMSNESFDFIWEGTIEEMLLVERDLIELYHLCVEPAVMLCMVRHRPKSPPSLSPEEEEDIEFKRAWLVYFWGRARGNGIQEDIGEERFKFWSSWRSQKSMKAMSQDLVDIARGLKELQTEGIENLLWFKSRKERAQNLGSKKYMDTTDIQKLARSLSLVYT